MSRRITTCGRFAVLAAFAVLTLPSTADAGTYRYYSCKTPSGVAAPTAGWQWTATNGSARFSNTCATGGPLQLLLEGDVSQPSDAQATVQFDAPSGTQVTGFRIWRSVRVSYATDTSYPHYGAAWPQTTDIRESCNPSDSCTVRGLHNDAFAAANLISWSGFPGGSSLYFNLACQNDTCPSRSEDLGDLRIHAAELTLSDTTTPVSQDVGGTLLGSGPHRGTETISFDATDSGGGVYRTVFEVDGVPVATAVPRDDAGRCADAGESSTDPYEFKARVPCPLSVVDGSTSFDTTNVPDGSHTLRVRLEDAAGNSTTLHGPVAFGVDNVPPPALQQGGEPSITGTPAVGAELAGSAGSWSGEGITYAYRWQRCEADGSACGTIGGADGERYTVTPEDAGRRLRLKVTATNAEGSTDAFSQPTATVAQPAGGGLAPAPGGGSSGDGSQGSPDGGAPNGEGASERARLTAHVGRHRSSSVRTRYGRPVVIEGRLLDPRDRPIAGASLSVSSQRLARGAGVDEHGSIRTGSDGGFRYTLAAGPSRVVRIGYRANTADTEFVATTEVTVLVQAGIWLRATPRRLRNGRVATFRGRVAGPLPVRGVLVDLQARVGRSWRTFAVVRTNRSGAYRFRHRFRQTFVKTRFRFRARVRRDSDFPYLAGTSRTASLVVRP